MTMLTVVHTASNASIKIHPFGATVFSYISGTGREQLFVSGSAILDGTKPIRGGIPIVFPIFGPPSGDSTMPQHGFARRCLWNNIKQYDTTESAGIVFELIVTKETVDFASVGSNNPWSQWIYNCTLQYTVDFTSKQMTTTLRIINTSTSTEFPFEALLHTYYKVDNHRALDQNVCYVNGLRGYGISDKVLKESSSIQDDNPITIPSIEVDRVYSPPQIGNCNNDVNVTVGVGIAENAAALAVRMSTIGYIVDSGVDEENSLKLPISCVVWNPYKEKAAGMADFGDDEYHDMICVEPGILKDSINTMPILKPGQVAVLKQTIFAAE